MKISAAPRYEGYDIIGDVHGCANTLEKLLQKLGYDKSSGGYCHPQRQAIFVGDILDRGPHIREAMEIVKSMTDMGSAQCLMGNHEYYALAYTTPAPVQSGRKHIREHTPRHNRLIAETLEQFACYPEEWRMYLDWIRTMPLFLEMPGFRVVHACWDENLIQQFKSRYGSNRIRDEMIYEALNPSSLPAQVFDRLLRGTHLSLPKGRSIKSRDGFTRNTFRTKFWSAKPQTYRDVVFQPDPLPDEFSDQSLSSSERDQLLHYPSGLPPVFVGHYWLQGTPKPLRKNVACLDYSAVKFGRLVAYRFDGESELISEKFVWVYVDPDT